MLEARLCRTGRREVRDKFRRPPHTHTLHTPSLLSHTAPHKIALPMPVHNLTRQRAHARTHTHTRASHTAPKACAPRTTTIYLPSYYHISVLILPYICPHTTIDLSSYYFVSVLILTYLPSYYCISVLMLLRICPHPSVYPSSY